MHSFHRKAITRVKVKVKVEAKYCKLNASLYHNRDFSLLRSSNHYTNSSERMPLEAAVEEVRGRSVRR